MNLDEVELKLDRADVHLSRLADGVRLFVDENQRRIPGVYHHDSEQYTFYTPELGFPKLPRQWATVIGDAVHNLSAALDYLAFALYSDVPENAEKGGRHVYFPIFDTASEYDTKGLAKIKGLRPADKAVIKRLQPFRADPRLVHPSDHPLTTLYQLEQKDKHRALTATVDLAQFHIRGLPDDVYTQPSLHSPTAEANALFATLKAALYDPDADVYLESSPRVIFDSNGPAPHQDIVQTLTEIRTHIRAVVVPAVARLLA